MTEWNAGGYYEQSAMQKWLAEKCLASVELVGTERVLDVGCGDGKITAEIAARLAGGSVVGVDPSQQMIDVGRQHFQPEHPNLRFEVGDATRLGFRDAFDVVVSFNALHWVTDQAAALSSIRQAVRPSGRAVLQLVCQGERRSLEDVIEETCTSAAWTAYFPAYRRPFLHLPPDDYRRLAEGAGWRVDRLSVVFESWDFGTRAAFIDFARVTFVEWTRRIPPAQHAQFIGDVLDRYQQVGDGNAAAAIFQFYQMRVALRRS